MIYALIVLYNKKIDESVTYNSLKKQKIKTIVYDNSNSEYTNYNKKYCDENNIDYYTTNKNVGLSKAYCYVIDKIEISNNNYIIMLDDDTTLNNDYFEELFEKVSKDNFDILLPIVNSNNKIISPCNVQNNCRIKMLNNIKELDINKVSAINTAMVIKTTVFNNIKYNDSMFLDYIDHDFMRKARNADCIIKVMHAKIEQNFSRFEKSTLDKELFRFKIYIRDFKIYCKESRSMLFYHVSTIRYRLKETIKYKSIKFLIVK